MHFKFVAASLVAVASSLVSSAGVKWAGINIAGFDFGCDILGNCTTAWVNPPLGGPYGGDGPGQMKQFASADKLNVFRLPVGWQYLVNNTLGGPLNAANSARYDQLVQACLSTGAYCIIDIHNYARWNGGIIGEGGPDPKYFANLWSQIAAKYKSQTRIVMGLMNEPHDLASVSNWASGAVQQAVNSIRAAGARTQYILLPGNGWTSAGGFVPGGSAAALAKVTDPSGGTSRLIFDVHQYFDVDGSGTHTACVTNHTADAFAPLATWLRSNRRMALLSETGGGSSDSSCLTYVCQAFDYLNGNSDVYLGWVGWAAGSFDSTYNLILAPQNGVDVPLVKQCIAGKFGQSGTTTATKTAAVASSQDNSAAADSDSSASQSSVVAVSRRADEDNVEVRSLAAVEEMSSDYVPPPRRRRRGLDELLGRPSLN